MIKKNDQPLSDLVRAFSQSKRIKPKLFQKKIEQGWQDMMGPWIQQETKSIRLKGQKLSIEIASAPLKQELHYAKDKIKERVNELLGEEYVEQVEIR